MDNNNIGYTLSQRKTQLASGNQQRFAEASREQVSFCPFVSEILLVLEKSPYYSMSNSIIYLRS